MMNRSYMALLALALIAQPSAAQEWCRSTTLHPSELARLLAPDLWFHDEERYFPTVPFFTAFDQMDNDGDSLVDLADPQEILPEAVPRRDEAPVGSWGTLRRLYDEALARTENPPVPTVFYRVRRLGRVERGTLIRYLLSDGPAMRRSWDDVIWPIDRLSETAFDVVEYYFYYLDDFGLTGHPEDIEFASVFLPTAAEDRCSLRIVVGAGHGARIPNNILVQVGEDASVLPVSFIVELGGHASIPDAGNDGQFELGRDINWHTPAAWGPRDVLARTGTGFLGEYRTDMTDSRSGPQWRVAWRLEAAVESEWKPVGYTLLPLDPFRELSERSGFSRPTGDLVASLDSVAGLLGTQLPQQVSPLAAAMVRGWNSPLTSEGGESLAASRRQIWRHSAYQGRSTDILASHLYPPSSRFAGLGDVIDLLNFGFEYRGRERINSVYVGMTLPLLTSSPISLPGFVQAYYGFDGRLGLLYESSYRDFGSRYVVFEVKTQGAEGAPFDRESLGVGVGVSGLPYLSSRLLLNALRVRVGAFATFGGEFDVQLQIAFRQ